MALSHYLSVVPQRKKCVDFQIIVVIKTVLSIISTSICQRQDIFLVQINMYILN